MQPSLYGITFIRFCIHTHRNPIQAYSIFCIYIYCYVTFPEIILKISNLNLVVNLRFYNRWIIISITCRDNDISSAKSGNFDQFCEQLTLRLVPTKIFWQSMLGANNFYSYLIKKKGMSEEKR